jgi:hypothetical protein
MQEKAAKHQEMWLSERPAEANGGTGDILSACEASLGFFVALSGR